MRQANEEATMLLEQAQKESDELRRGALAYTNDLLADAKLHIQQALKDSDAVHQRYQDALKQSATVIEGNQNELMAQLGGTASSAGQAASNTAVEPNKEEEIRLEPAPNKTETLELDEDAFIKEDL